MLFRKLRGSHLPCPVDVGLDPKVVENGNAQGKEHALVQVARQLVLKGHGLKFPILDDDGGVDEIALNRFNVHILGDGFRHEGLSVFSTQTPL